MVKITNKKANDNKRVQILEELKKFFNEKDEDIIQTSSNKIAFPFVNELGSDEWVEITVSIPLGSRKNNEVFDGYEQAEQYQAKQKEKLEKEKEKEEEKEKKKIRDEKRRKKKKENVEKREK